MSKYIFRMEGHAEKIEEAISGRKYSVALVLCVDMMMAEVDVPVFCSLLRKIPLSGDLMENIPIECLLSLIHILTGCLLSGVSEYEYLSLPWIQEALIILDLGLSGSPSTSPMSSTDFYPAPSVPPASLRTAKVIKKEGSRVVDLLDKLALALQQAAPAVMAQAGSPQPPVAGGKDESTPPVTSRMFRIICRTLASIQSEIKAILTEK